MKKLFMPVAVVAYLFFSTFTNGFAQGTVSGKVNFEGTAPVPKPVNFGAEKQCALVHGDKPPMEETIVVNSNNTLKNTLVYIKEGVSGTFETPKDALEINQRGCVFSPHVAAGMAGQTVRFKNGDDLLHNVRSISQKGQTFNIAQPIKDMSIDKVFKQPEIGIQLKCDVHFWMLSYLHIFEHPFFAVTGEDGSFTIPNLPAGTYTLEAWHEKLGTLTQSITVADGEDKTTSFTFAA